MFKKRVTVFGGSGFVGSCIVNALLENGFLVNVFTRDKENVRHLKVGSSLGSLNILVGSIFDPVAVENAVMNADVVINCVGAIAGKKKHLFDVNYFFPKLLVEILNNSENKVEHVIHFSAILNEASNDNYTKSKLSAQALFKTTKCKASVVNPSVVFGPDDNFFNFFAKLRRFFYFLPLINKGRAMIQPVYVFDVAQFVVQLINERKSGEFFLVGEKAYSVTELLAFICDATNKKKVFVNVPLKLAMFCACICQIPLLYCLTKLITGNFAPLITQDQVSLLFFDNISNVNSLVDFGIKPKSIEEIVPQYLERFK